MLASIRVAVLDDAPGIARVHVDSWRSTYAGIVSATFLENLSLQKRTESWQNMLSTTDSRSFFYIAEEHGKIVGFITGMAERESDPVFTAEVGGIYLLKQSQGQGIGRKLMRSAACKFLEQGHTAMLLWVLKDNLPARKFYEALGGKFLREKSIKIGDQQLPEISYGWDDLRSLV